MTCGVIYTAEACIWLRKTELLLVYLRMNGDLSMFLYVNNSNSEDAVIQVQFAALS
jgi:hypothetical protein